MRDQKEEMSASVHFPFNLNPPNHPLLVIKCGELFFFFIDIRLHCGVYCYTVKMLNYYGEIRKCPSPTQVFIMHWI